MSDDIFGSNSTALFFLNDTIWGNGLSFFSVVDIVTLVLSFSANSYVIWLIGSGTGNGLSAEFFNLNLSICEMLACLNTFLDLSDLCPFVFTYPEQGLIITGRPLFQSLICVERYLAVVHPVTFLKSKSLRYRLICCAFAWTVIFVSCMTNTLLYLFSNIIVFVFSFPLAQLFFFFSVQLFCCLAVLRALKQSGPGEKAREKQEENHMKRRAFKVILIITVAMVIIYIPSIITSLLFLLSFSESDISSMFTEYSYSLGGLVQPFLFLHRVGKLRFTKCR